MNLSWMDSIEIIATTKCIYCQKDIKNQLVRGIGHPYNALIHEHCLPFFNWSQGWPHLYPREIYRLATENKRKEE